MSYYTRRLPPPPLRDPWPFYADETLSVTIVQLVACCQVVIYPSRSVPRNSLCAAQPQNKRGKSRASWIGEEASSFRTTTGITFAAPGIKRDSRSQSSPSEHGDWRVTSARTREFTGKSRQQRLHNHVRQHQHRRPRADR